MLHHRQPQGAARWWTVDFTIVLKLVTDMRLDTEVEKKEGASIRGLSLMKSTLSSKGHRPGSALVAESVAVRAALASDVATQKGTDLGREEKKNAKAATRSGGATAAIRLDRPLRQDMFSQLVSFCVMLNTSWWRLATGTRSNAQSAAAA